ncbi:MAG: hypothetical protein Q9170_004050 [Blastenia crenularia]
MDSSSILSSRHNSERAVSELSNLPNELLHNIFSYLEKPQLKLVRQCCKRFASNAVPLLFTVVVVSGSSTDMDVFTAIANRSDLAASISTLVYDVQSFENLEKISEDVGECRQWLDLLDIRDLDTGLTAWETQLEQQKSRFNDAFVEILAEGLSKLPNLANIIIQTYWEKVDCFDFRAKHEGDYAWNNYYYGLLARSWGWPWLRPRMLRQRCDVELLMFALFQALTKAGCFFSRLDLGHSPTVYKCVGAITLDPVRLFSLPLGDIPETLTSLRLDFDGTNAIGRKFDERLRSSGCSIIPDVPSLKTLDIRCSPEISGPGRSDGLTYEDIRSKIAEAVEEYPVYGRLETLKLDGLCIVSASFLAAMARHQSLRELYLDNISIGEGSWLELFGGLRNALDLTDFGIDRRYRDVDDLKEAQHYRDGEFAELTGLVEEYVVGQIDDLTDFPLEGIGGRWVTIW